VLFQEGDQTSVSFVARSLVTLQQLYGTIPTMYGLGDCAKVCTNMLERKLKQGHLGFNSSEHVVVVVLVHVRLFD